MKFDFMNHCQTNPYNCQQNQYNLDCHLYIVYMVHDTLIISHLKIYIKYIYIFFIIVCILHIYFHINLLPEMKDSQWYRSRFQILLHVYRMCICMGNHESVLFSKDGVCEAD